MGVIRAPQQARGEASLERLLDAAEDLLVEHGVAGLTTAALSARSGLSNGAIYWRFSSLDSVFTAVHQRLIERLVHAQESYLDNPDWQSLSLPDYVEKSVRVQCEAILTNAGTLRTLVLSAASDQDASARGSAAVREAERRFVEHLLPRLADHGINHPREAAAVTFRFVTGALIMRVTWPEQAESEISEEQFIQGLCQAAARYLCSKTTAAHPT